MKKEKGHAAAHMHMKKAAHHSEMAMKAMKSGNSMPGNPKEEKRMDKKGDKKGSKYP